MNAVSTLIQRDQRAMPHVKIEPDVGSPLEDDSHQKLAGRFSDLDFQPPEP
jgi:hypothetical protein